MSDNPLVNLGDLTKPATVFIEKISNAIGTLYEPRKIKNVAEAEAEAAKIKAQSEAEVAKIEAQSEIEVTNLQRRAMQRVIAEEARNQQNMEQIIEKAVPQLNEDANPSEMDNDWIANFFDKSRLISDSEMQMLWSKILAGEANSPGNFSKRTVNFIAELEKSEADLFTRLCSFGWSFGGSFHPLVFDENAEIYNRYGINFEVLSHLDSIGLVQFNPTVGYKQKNLRRKGNVFYHDRLLHLEMSQDNDSNEIHIGKVILTGIGEQLVPICGSQPVDGFYDYVKHQLRHYLPWSDKFFDRAQFLPDVLNLCFWDGQISNDKWEMFCTVFCRGGYMYSQRSPNQPVSLATAKEKFLPRIAEFTHPNLTIRISFGDIQITIPSAYQSLYDETEFNSQNEWVSSGSLHVNLRASQSVGTCVLLYPEGLHIDSIKRKVEGYLQALITAN